VKVSEEVNRKLVVLGGPYRAVVGF